MAKVSTLVANKHADYDATRLSQLDALYGDRKKWKQHISFWLPQAPAEANDLWMQRKQRALYSNHFAPIINVVAAMLFSEEPSVTGLNERNAERYAKSADNDGNHGRVVFQSQFIDALRYGYSWLWIRLPDKSGQKFASRADQEAAGQFDWWLEKVDPATITDWYEKDQRLQWVKVADVIYNGSDPLGARLPTFRWRIIDDTKWTEYTWTPKDEAEATLALADPSKAHNFPPGAEAKAKEYEHGFGVLPIRRFAFKNNMALGPRMFDPAVAAIRAEHNLDEALFKAAHALLVIAATDHDKNVPVLGHGHYLRVWRDKDGADTATFAEPSGNNTKLLADRARVAISDLYATAQQFQSGGHASSSPGAMYQSGASKQMDWYAAEAQNASYADQIAAFITDVMSAVAKITGDSGTVKVAGLEGWHQMDIAGMLQASTLAFDAKVMSPTFQRSLARNITRRLLSNTEDPEVMAAIYKEIDEYDIGPLGLAGRFATGMDAGKAITTSGNSAPPKYPRAPADSDKDGKIGE